MRTKIKALLTNILQKLVESFKRFPEAILLAAGVTVSLIVINHLPSSEDALSKLLGHIAMVLALGIPLTLCWRVLFEKMATVKSGIRLILYLLSALSLLLYYIYLLPDYEPNTISRYLAVNLALYCGFAFIPYLDKRPGFEQYVVILLRQFLITALYSFVLFLGLVATIFTIDQLLFKLPSRLYVDIWLLVVGIFAPSFFLSGVPAIEENFAEVDYAKILKVLLYFIVMPLIAIYTFILYLYFAKILITREWPVGMVSHLVLWYAMITIFISFIIYPQRTGNRWVDGFLLSIPKLLIPLLLMMFVAMGIRIKAYGITENRYFVLIAGIWTLGSTLYIAFVKNKRNVILVVTLACLALLSVFGPWSAYSVSRRSQYARLEAILDRNNMLQNGKLVKAPSTISEEDRKEISSIVLYFDRYHKLSDLKFLPEDAQIDSLEKRFGFPIEYYYAGDEQYFYLRAENNTTPLLIRDFAYFYTFEPGMDKTAKQENSPLEVTYRWEDKKLVIKQQGEEIYSKDFNEIGEKLYLANKEKGVLSQADLSFSDENEKLQLLYVFKYLSGYEKRSTGEVTIDPPEFYLFVKFK